MKMIRLGTIKTTAVTPNHSIQETMEIQDDALSIMTATKNNIKQEQKMTKPPPEYLTLVAWWCTCQGLY